MARFRSNAFTIASTAVVIAVFAWLVTKNLAYIGETVRLDAGIIALLGLLTMVTFLIRAIMNVVMFSPLGVRAPFHYWLALVITSTLANALPFVAGAAAKGYLLKRIHKLPYSTFAGGQLALFALTIATNGVVGMLLLACFFPARADPIVWGFFVAMALACVVLAVPKVIRRWVGEARFPWPDWSPSDRLRAWLGSALCQGAILLVSGVKLYLCFSMGREQVTLAACILFSASVAVSRLAAITPGAIGVREFLIGSLAYLTGFAFRDALIASTIDRIVELVVVGGLSPVMSYYFQRMIRKTETAIPMEAPPRE